MAKTDYDYSDFQDHKPGDNILATISGLAHKAREQERRIEKLETDLQEARDAYRETTERHLPEAMEAARSSLHQTDDGLQVAIKEKIRANIPKPKEAEAFEWMDENGHGELIKRQFVIEFGRDEERWANKFEGDLKKRKRQLAVQRKKSVHNGTLVKFCTEQLAEGQTLPESISVFRQKFATVEVPDAKTVKRTKKR